MTEALALRVLQQLALEVDVILARNQLVEVVQDDLLDKRATGFQPSVQVDRADQRFERVAENRGLLKPSGVALFPAQEDKLAQIDAARLSGEHRATDDQGLHLG